jgi:hypothetical protein
MDGCGLCCCCFDGYQLQGREERWRQGAKLGTDHSEGV